MSVFLFVLRIHTCGGGEQKAPHAIQTACVQHVRIDQDVVPRDVGVVCRNVADTTHIGCQVIDLVDVLGRLEAVLPEPQIEQGEVVGRTWLELRRLDVRTPDPETLVFQPPDEVMPDKTARAGHKNPWLIRHESSSLQIVAWRTTVILSDGHLPSNLTCG